MTRENVTNVN